MNEQFKKLLKGSAIGLAIGIVGGIAITNAVVNKQQQATLADHELRIKSLEEQVADANYEVELLETKLKAQMDTLQNEIKDTNNIVNNILNNVSALQQDIDAMISNIDGLEARLTAIEEDIPELIALVEEYDSELAETLRQELADEVEHLMAVIRADYSCLDHDIQALETDIEEDITMLNKFLNLKINAVRDDLTALINTKIEELQAYYNNTIDSIDRRLDDLEEGEVHLVNFFDEDTRVHTEFVKKGDLATFYEYSDNDYVKGHFWTSDWTYVTTNRHFDPTNDVYTTSEGQDTWKFDIYTVQADMSLTAVKNYFMDSNHEFNLPIEYNVTNKTEFELPEEMNEDGFFVDLGDKSPETTLPVTFSKGKTTINSYQYKTSYPGWDDPEFIGVYFTGMDYEEFTFTATGARLVSETGNIDMPIYEFYNNTTRGVWDTSKDKNALVGETYDVVIDGTEKIVVDVDATYARGLYRFCWSSSTRYGFEDSYMNKLMDFSLDKYSKVVGDSLEIWLATKHEEQMINAVSMEVITNEELTLDDIEVLDGNGEVLTLTDWYEYGFASIDLDEERDPSENFLTDQETEEVYTRLYELDVFHLDQIAAQDITIRVNKKASIGAFGGFVYIEDYKKPDHFDQQVVIDSIATSKILFNGEDIKVGAKVTLDVKEGDVIKIVLPHQYLLGLVEYHSALETANSYDEAKGRLGAKVSGGHDTWTNTEEVTEITVEYNRSYYITVGYASI